MFWVWCTILMARRCLSYVPILRGFLRASPGICAEVCTRVEFSWPVMFTVDDDIGHQCTLISLFVLWIYPLQLLRCCPFPFCLVLVSWVSLLWWDFVDIVLYARCYLLQCIPQHRCWWLLFWYVSSSMPQDSRRSTVCLPMLIVLCRYRLQSKNRIEILVHAFLWYTLVPYWAFSSDSVQSFHL